MDEIGPDLNKTLEDLGSALVLIAKQRNEDKQEHRREMSEVNGRIDDLRDDVNDAMDGLKESQYLEPYQAAKVSEAAKSRVASILHKWCADNGADWNDVYRKYYGKLVRLVHNDAKKAGLEIGKIIYTPKRHYELLLDFIGEWYPNRGVKGQMEYYDGLASD